MAESGGCLNNLGKLCLSSYDQPEIDDGEITENNILSGRTVIECVYGGSALTFPQDPHFILLSIFIFIFLPLLSTLPSFNSFSFCFLWWWWCLSWSLCLFNAFWMKGLKVFPLDPGDKADGLSPGLFPMPNSCALWPPYSRSRSYQRQHFFHSCIFTANLHLINNSLDFSLFVSAALECASSPASFPPSGLHPMSQIALWMPHLWLFGSSSTRPSPSAFSRFPL